jgi:hypothetical protein
MGRGFKAVQAFDIESRGLQAVVGLSAKPSKALRDGSGLDIKKPWAAKSRAVDPAFRPGRAGKPLISRALSQIIANYAR